MSSPFDIPLFDTFGLRVRVPASLWRVTGNRGRTIRNRWRMAVAYSDGLCSYCGQRKPLTVDHVDPIGRGGRDVLANKVPACKTCNGTKSDRTLLMFLLGAPR